MERNIEFLQKQHKDALETLHAEIDRLNRENKELQFKLIMESPEPSCKASSCVTQRIHTESNKFQADLQQNVEFPCLQLNTDTSNQLKYQETSTSSKTTKSSLEGPADAKAGFITSLQPLMIQFSPYQVPRPPSLYECEVLIRQLYRANSMQSQEILCLKAVLKDIVFTQKITPDNYILIKPYLTDGKRAANSEKFPQLAFQTLPKGLPVSQSSKGGKVILPALKQSKNNVAERHRRIQAAQRHRLQKNLP